MFSRKVTAILGVALMLIASWIFRADLMSMMRWFSNFEAVTTDMRSIGLFGPIVLFILFVLQVFLAFIPGQALMVACGYLYGFWGGFLLSWPSLHGCQFLRLYPPPGDSVWLLPEQYC